ncbi:MAG: SDR family NAD(P)-dependent oxidoreductase [Streptosporangiales bacterium]|nr:SDR family NAD(P)-dependent oxidoreductase [Streptosporangiales bacterium]
MRRNTQGYALAGRRVLLTGAAGAFGSATAAALRERGAAVAGLDIAAAGPDAGFDGDGDARHGVFPCDITDDAQVSARVPEAVDRLGGLDALVHLAGVGEPVDAGARPGSEVHRTLEVNLLGPWRVTAAALPELVRSRGRLVFVASELAYAVLPFAAAYAVSKRGLTAYADVVRLEYGTHVAVTTVYPGYVRTPIHDASLAAGLSLEGQVRRERVDDIVATVLRVLAARRPPRDVAATRLGGIELWLARHLPAAVERVIRARVARDLRRYVDVPLARGLVRRYGERNGVGVARGADAPLLTGPSEPEGGQPHGPDA